MAFPRIGLFGGTFDPIHEGHLEIARKALAELNLDRLILIPCRQSPHKTGKPGASDEDRLEMLRLVTSSDPRLAVDPLELERPPPSYTWSTVRELKKQFPSGSQLFLLIGLDQWESLPRWAHPERLADDVEFIVVGRNGFPAPRPGYNAHFLEGNHPASSTLIRKSLAAGKPPEWIPDSVLAFINEKGLYS